MPATTRSTKYTFPLAAALLLALMATVLITSDVFAQSDKPGRPTDLTASSVSHNGVELSWTASTGGAAVKHYIVLRRNLDDSAGTMERIDTSTGTSYSDSGLQPETQYAYRVKAVGTDGQKSRQSQRVVVTTAADPAERDTADADPADQQGRNHTDQPQNLVYGAVYQRATIAWDTPPANITHVKIERTGGSYADTSTIESVRSSSRNLPSNPIPATRTP